jgi:N-acylglucosamine-6-phosphate 2-epimerase
MNGEVIERIHGGLVVSCQAPRGHPLRRPDVIGLLVRCAEAGGAIGVRVNGPTDIEIAKSSAAIPVIGLFKVAGPARDLITPGIDRATRLVRAGADIVAVEVTDELGGEQLDVVRHVRDVLGVPVMADVSTHAEGVRAWQAGADLVATTLSGYTHQTSAPGDLPDVELVERLHAEGIRTVAEGRYHREEQIEEVFRRGAWAAVVGTAITDPVAITRRFCRAVPATTAQRPR